MGNQSSVVDPTHVRMYHHLLQIQDPSKRVQIIQTCLSSVEHVQSAKRAGVYSHLLHYVSVAQSGHLPAPLPGEGGRAPSAPVSSGSLGGRAPLSYPSSSSSSASQQIQTYSEAAPSWKVVTDTPKQKAISYFAACLEVLGIQEEVALTEEALKKAYKRMAIKSHPDKGGSEEAFEAVTRAYAYLSEILRYMRGKGGAAGAAAGAGGAVSARDAQAQRAQEAEQWKHVEPVRLSAKNLDMNAFNKLFEQHHLPDPDADGYGDWLKGSESSSSAGQEMKFKGQFNRDVFNRMFEDEAKRSQRTSNQLVVHPGEMALTLNPTSGTDLVSERPSSFTAAPNSRFQYTDLRGAYTSDSTISDKVSNVTVAERRLDEYRASRERAPDPLSSEEMRGIQEFEQRSRLQESTRERKRAELAVQQQDYFNRMKRMVITDGVDLNQGKLTYH